MSQAAVLIHHLRPTTQLLVSIPESPFTLNARAHIEPQTI